MNFILKKNACGVLTVLNTFSFFINISFFLKHRINPRKKSAYGVRTVLSKKIFKTHLSPAIFYSTSRRLMHRIRLGIAVFVLKWTASGVRVYQHNAR